MNFKKLLYRIGNDIKNRRNIDAYVVSAFAIVFAVFSLVGNDRDWVKSLQTPIILSALGLLVYNITTPKQEVADLDSVLNDRANFQPFPETVKNRRQVWIYGASAVNLLSDDNMDHLRREILNKPDGEFRVIIQNPTKHDMVNILVKQLDESLDYAVQHLPDAIQQTMNNLNRIKSWSVQGQFDYKLLDYSPGFSMVAVDADERDGFIIVEFYGFHNVSTGSRMHIKISRQDSEHWFNYWREQFDYMWDEAKLP